MIILTWQSKCAIGNIFPLKKMFSKKKNWETKSSFKQGNSTSIAYLAPLLAVTRLMHFGGRTGMCEVKRFRTAAPPPGPYTTAITIWYSQID